MITGKVIERLPPSLKSRIENNHELRTIIGNINWLTLENILKNLISLFVMAWVARYLGPEKFGLMNYAVAFVGMFSVLSTLGLDDIVIRDIVSNPEKKEQYLGSTLILKFIGSLLMIVSSFIAISFVEEGNSLVIIFVLILSSAYIFKSLDVIDLWFRSQVKSQYSVYSRLVAFLIVSGTKVLLVLTGAPLIIFVGMFAMDSILASLFLLYFYKKKAKSSLLRWKIEVKVIKELLRNSWPLILSGLALMVEANIDQVMLKNMVSAEEVGIYSAALKLIIPFGSIPLILKSSFFPSIVKAKKKSDILYKKKLYQFYQIMMIMFVLVSVPIIIIGPFLSRILYGEGYAGVALLLPLMSSRLFFANYGTARGNFIVNENLMKYSFLTMLIGAILNIGLNIILIPRFQSVGAIVVSMISFFVATFFIDLFYKRTRANALMMFKSMFNFYKLFLK